MLFGHLPDSKTSRIVYRERHIIMHTCLPASHNHNLMLYNIVILLYGLHDYTVVKHVSGFDHWMRVQNVSFILIHKT